MAQRPCSYDCVLRLSITTISPTQVLHQNERSRCAEKTSPHRSSRSNTHGAMMPSSVFTDEGQRLAMWPCRIFRHRALPSLNDHAAARFVFAQVSPMKTGSSSVAGSCSGVVDCRRRRDVLLDPARWRAGFLKLRLQRDQRNARHRNNRPRCRVASVPPSSSRPVISGFSSIRARIHASSPASAAALPPIAHAAGLLAPASVWSSGSPMEWAHVIIACAAARARPHAGSNGGGQRVHGNRE